MEYFFFLSLLVIFVSNPVTGCSSVTKFYRLQVVPEMTPVLVNKDQVMVWVDYKPALDAIFGKLSEMVANLSSNNTRELYFAGVSLAYQNFTNVDRIFIGSDVFRRSSIGGMGVFFSESPSRWVGVES